MLLKESSLIREAERRSLSQENIQNKENRRGGMFGRGRGGRPPGGFLPSRDAEGPETSKHEGPARANGAASSRMVSPHKNDLPMADPVDLAEIANDPTKSLNIDGQMRSIRHYGETSTIVLEDDKICELTFHSEPVARRIIIDDSVVVFCPLNAITASEFKLQGVTHRIKIGNPSRELCIDGQWYDCYFNNTKIKVKIGDGWHYVLLEGPLPSVKIGLPRPDLCLARVYLMLDANVDHRVPIFLDRKPQLVPVSGKPHVLRFVEGFRTLTINGHPFRTDFGGFPMVISVGGQKHYLRLTDLPPSVRLVMEPKQLSKPLSPKQESGIGTVF